MKSGYARKCVIATAFASLSIACVTATLAADAPKMTMPAPSKEMRDKMASVHDKMAACLRSEKAFDECRTEMMSNCQSVMGQQGCAQMGMQGHGMMHKPATSTPAEKK